MNMMNEAEISNAVRSLVRINPGQCTYDEYMEVAMTLRSCGHSNALIFGAGKDTRLWASIAAGEVCIIESDDRWIGVARNIAEVRANVSVVRVKYEGTTVSNFRDEMSQGVDRLSLRKIVDDVASAWGVVFVDAPAGGRPEFPGRLRSIATASMLAKLGRAQHILVHDCDRELEASACDAMLTDLSLVAEIGKLRHYARRSDEAALGRSF